MVRIKNAVITAVAGVGLSVLVSNAAHFAELYEAYNDHDFSSPLYVTFRPAKDKEDFHARRQHLRDHGMLIQLAFYYPFLWPAETSARGLYQNE